MKWSPIGDLPHHIPTRTMDFRTACMNNDLALAKSMWAKNSMRAVDMDLVFLEIVACGSRRLVMAKWLVSLGVVNVNAYNGYAFVAACGNNHLETAQWVHSLAVGDARRDSEAFLRACMNGHVEIAQWILYQGTIVIHDTCQQAFLRACGPIGRLEVAKWLHTQGVDIHFGGDLPFRTAYQYGRTDLVKWMWSLGGFMSPACILSAVFQYACSHGYMDLAKWAQAEGMLDVHDRDDVAFVEACFNNDVEMIKWLRSFC